MEPHIIQNLKINGVTYAVRIHKEDSSLPYLLMLHGFMGDSRCFEHLIEGLGKTCNPVTLDLLGHGNTEKIYEAERYQEDKQIKDILTLAKKTLASPTFLYGYSMGGRLALKTACKEPTLFKGLILESTSYGIIEVEKREERKETDRLRARHIQQDFKKFLKEWEELPLFQSPDTSDQELKERYKQIQHEQDPDALAASLRGFGTGYMTPANEHNKNYSGPALLLAGSNDQKYIDISKNLKELFGKAEIRILTAGHRVHLDNPQELTQQINLFIQQNT